MEPKEMKEKFDMLYDYMATSNEPKYMRVFGKTMKEMMYWLADNDPDTAKDFLDKLSAVKWNNYLSDKEADKIIAAMSPKAVWSKDQWAEALETLGIVSEESPYYNANALFVTMSMVYSDSAKTIATLMGKTLEDVENAEMLKATHALALDKLKDADRRFDIRQYFGV